MPGRILIVDDDRSMCELLEVDLRRRGYQADATTSSTEALVRLKDGDFDVVLTDLNMPELGGDELCQRVVANRPDIPVVVITAFGSLESSVAAIRAGAYDFVTKPIELDLLALVLERALQHRRLQAQVKLLRQTAGRSQPFEEFIGESPPMQSLFDDMDRIASTEASVLLTGESGTGKELAARALHRRSGRSDGPFVTINCSAIPEALLESELFGHCRGAFTDARTARTGLFVAADGGTLFLDEIGELPPTIQPKLLRALEERRVRPVGGTEEVPFDVRLLAATNRDLEADVTDGRFREDLFFRINVIHLHLPPLRSRGSDVLLLAQNFCHQFAERHGKPVAGLSRGVAERLLSYD